MKKLLLGALALVIITPLLAFADTYTEKYNIYLFTNNYPYSQKAYSDSLLKLDEERRNDREEELKKLNNSDSELNALRAQWAREDADTLRQIELEGIKQKAIIETERIDNEEKIKSLADRTSKIIACINSLGQNAWANEKGDGCVCTPGYELIAGRCSNPADVNLCSKIAEHFEYKGERNGSIVCDCESGFTLAPGSAIACVPNAPLIQRMTGHVQSVAEWQASRSATEKSKPTDIPKKIIQASASSTSPTTTTTQATTTNPASVNEFPWYQRIWKFIWRF